MGAARVEKETGAEDGVEWSDWWEKARAEGARKRGRAKGTNRASRSPNSEQNAEQQKFPFLASGSSTRRMPKHAMDSDDHQAERCSAEDDVAEAGPEDRGRNK